MTDRPVYSREELLTAVEEVINHSEDFEDGFRAGMEHGALSVLENLTGEEWVHHWIWEINLSSDAEWSDEEVQEFIDEFEKCDQRATNDEI